MSTDPHRDDRAFRAVWRELRKPRVLLRSLRKSGDVTVPPIFAGPTFVLLSYVAAFGVTPADRAGAEFHSPASQSIPVLLLVLAVEGHLFRDGVTGSRRPSQPRAADIEFAASIEADKLHFDQPPETDVRFFGEPGHESASGSDRTNLPEEVEPGVTYRNVRVDYRLATRLVEATSRARKPARGPGPNDRPP